MITGNQRAAQTATLPDHAGAQGDSNGTPLRQAYLAQPVAAVETPMAGMAPADIRLFAACQQALQESWRLHSGSLIRTLGGVCLHARWPMTFEAATVPPPSVCPLLGRRSAAAPESCHACVQTNWPLTVNAGSRGRCFTAACGARNFWGTIQVNGWTVVSMTLAARKSVTGTGASGSAPRAVQRRQVVAASANPRSSTFARGVCVVRLMLHDLQQTAFAICAQRALEDAHRRSLEQRPGLVAPNRYGRQAPRGSRGQAPLRDRPTRGAHAVRMMVQHIQQHYAEPIHLKGLAPHFGMNAAYASELFSRLTGLAFHDYLHQLRLGHAKRLLQDPLTPIKEVAQASGYSDPNTFRQIFKSKTGLAPSAWRLSL